MERSAFSTGGTENGERSGLLAGGRLHARIRLSAEEDGSSAQEKPLEILLSGSGVHWCCGDGDRDPCGASTEDQLTESRSSSQVHVEALPEQRRFPTTCGSAPLNSLKLGFYLLRPSFLTATRDTRAS